MSLCAKGPRLPVRTWRFNKLGLAFGRYFVGYLTESEESLTDRWTLLCSALVGSGERGGLDACRSANPQDAGECRCFYLTLCQILTKKVDAECCKRKKLLSIIFCYTEYH